MRLRYNPKHLGDKEQAWRSFLIGSMAASSAIFLMLTENALVFIVTLAMIVAGFLLFVYNNMNFTKATYVSQNLLSAGTGLVLSLVFNAAGFLLLYLGVILILMLVTWLHRFTTKGKAEKGRGKEGETGKEEGKTESEKRETEAKEEKTEPEKKPAEKPPEKQKADEKPAS